VGAGVTPTDALRSGFALLGGRTRDTLTLYLLAAGAVFAARVPLLVALGVAVAVLASQGRIEPVIEQLGELDSQLGEGGLAGDPSAPGATPELPAGLEQAIAGLVTPTTTVLFLLGVLLTLLAVLVAQAVGSAVTLCGIAGALDDDDPVAAGLSGLSRTASYLGVWFVRVALLAAVTGLALVVGSVGATLGPVGALLGLITVFVWLLAVLLVLALLAFAGQALAVDEVGVAGAVKASVTFPVREPFGFVVYVVVGVVAYGGAGVLSLLLSALGVPRLAALVALLAVPPVVDGFKTALYAGRSLPPVGDGSAGATGVRADGGGKSGDDPESDGSDDPDADDGETETGQADDGFVWGTSADGTESVGDDTASRPAASESTDSGSTDEPLPDAEEFTDPDSDSDTDPDSDSDTDPDSDSDTDPDSDSDTDPDSRPGVGTRLVGGFRRGLAELGRFLVGHPLTNLAGVLLFALGIGAGWQLTAGVGTRLGGPANVATVFGETPLEATAVFGNIAANNWLVAATASFGGLGFGIPTTVSLLFNGVLIGALGGVFDRLTFLALVAPHGVIEIPALAVAGGLGLHLGRVGYRGLRGRLSVAAVADELRRGFDVLVGLAVVFVIAAAVEAYLTPALAAWILG
jgi:uncharacterized membrane protein SpoIIM required for sporulation